MRRCFNTASGKYCCNCIKVAKELLRQQRCFNTASGKYCCNKGFCFVAGTEIATRFNTASGKYCCNLKLPFTVLLVMFSFNTASGKYCCNGTITFPIADIYYIVSIPQAVSTVATWYSVRIGNLHKNEFQYRKR